MGALLLLLLWASLFLTSTSSSDACVRHSVSALLLLGATIQPSLSVQNSIAEPLAEGRHGLSTSAASDEGDDPAEEVFGCRGDGGGSSNYGVR